MRIQYQPICDVIATLAESAQEIADDFFRHHTLVDQRDADLAGHSPSRRLTLVAKDATGRDQQRQLTKLLDDIDRLSGSTYCWRELRQQTLACRETFAPGAQYRDSAHNHNAAFRESSSEMIQIARDMPDDAPGEVLLVPDLRAVLDFPELENWTFPQFAAFHLVLPSALICELEALQNSALDQMTWKKCTAAIRQLHDYLRRVGGKEGAVLDESGNVVLHIRPLESIFDDAVSWLDPASPEDRIVARVVALIREHPRCVVALATRDAKLQERAEESRIDTVPTLAFQRDSE
jgi:PIN domain